jgi:hypothetical protein
MSNLGGQFYEACRTVEVGQPDGSCRIHSVNSRYSIHAVLALWIGYVFDLEDHSPQLAMDRFQITNYSSLEL